MLPWVYAATETSQEQHHRSGVLSPSSSHLQQHHHAMGAGAWPTPHTEGPHLAEDYTNGSFDPTRKRKFDGGEPGFPDRVDSQSPVEMKPDVVSLNSEMVQGPRKKPKGEKGVSKLVVSGLPLDSEKATLKALFTVDDAVPLDVRILERDENGFKCGAAFIDMPSVDAARVWMETFEGTLIIGAGTACVVEFARPYNEDRDWTCATCALDNAAEYTTCANCLLWREESEEMTARGLPLVGDAPCDTLLLRDLPKGVTGPRIAEVLSRMAQVLPIQHIHLGKSRKFAFVQMRSTAEAEMLLDCLKRAPLLMDGKIVLSSFSCTPFVEWKNAQRAANAAAAASQAPPVATAPEVTNVPIVAQTIAQQAAIVPSSIHPGVSVPSASAPEYSSTNAAASIVEQARMHAAQQKLAHATSIAQRSAPLMSTGLQQPPSGIQFNTSMPPPGMVIANTSVPPPGMPNLSMPPPGFGGIGAGLQTMGGFGGGPAPFMSTGQPNMSMPPPNIGMPTQFSMPPPGMQQPLGIGQPTPTVIFQIPPGGGQPIVSAAPVVVASGPFMTQAASAPLVLQATPITSLASAPVAVTTTQAAPIQAAPPGGVIGTVDTPYGNYPQYVTPNPASFADEPSSGYKVDMVTMFYYDPKSKYYYVNALNKWCLWDPMYSTYIPVDQKAAAAKAAQEKAMAASIAASASATTATHTTTPMAEQKSATPERSASDDVEDAESKKTSADVAREMMRWAKRQEKEKQKLTFSLTRPKRVGEAGAHESRSGGDLGFKMLEKIQNPLRHPDMDSSDEEMERIQEARGAEPKRTPSSIAAEASTAATSGGQVAQKPSVEAPPAAAAEPVAPVHSAQQQREEMERSLIDRNSKTCLLCRRAFPSVDVLEKHVAKSDLHKKNLEAKRVEWGKAYVAQLMAAASGAF